MTETIDQLRTLYEREKAKNLKLMAVVEALKMSRVRLFGAWQMLSAICETDTSYDRRQARHKAWLGVQEADKALAALGER